MYPVFIKEINSFFSSVVGYVALLVFLLACGLFMWLLPDNMLDYGYANLDKFFEMAPWLLILLIPAITMRCFTDEFKSGTIEWLITKPISSIQIILGKYFASLLLVVFALLLTTIYIFSIHQLAAAKTTLDSGGIMGSYLGLFFLSAAFTAIGVFCSSLTSNQIVGFLIALFACFLLYMGIEQLTKLPVFANGFDYYLGMIGLAFHYNSISRGIIDSRDVVYFVSIVVLFLALTQWSLTKRMWS